MIKTVVFFIVFLVLSSLTGLTGCGQDKILSGDEMAIVLGFSETATDNLFAGLTANDYETFSHHFDSDMYKELPATDFAAWKQELDNEIGAYIFRNVDKVSQSDEFYVVVYRARFEKEEPVTVTVAFHASDLSIAFLSLDSEKFSWSAVD